MKYRVGRKLGRTIYRQRGPLPGDQDYFIGIMDSVRDAQLVVDALNVDQVYCRCCANQDVTPPSVVYRTTNGEPGGPA